MNDKTKNIVVTVWFLAFIFIIAIINILTPDKDVSKSERRKLTQFSSLNYENFTSNFEKYSLDQFVGRDLFRQVKAYITYNIFNQKDNNDIYIVNGQVSKYNSFLDENSVINLVKKYNTIYNNFFKNNNVYYSIIPDKNYYIAEKNGYPSIDYEKLVNLAKSNINSNIKYIDLFDELNENNYYKTDIHWRQETLSNVVNKLSKEMGFSIVSSLTNHTLPNFYGNYYGQSALPISSEDLIYCTNDAINNAKVSIFNEQTFKFDEAGVYNLDAYNGIDPYDIFLSGAKSIIKIENENATTDKELIIFRDSFGSSLTPLLIEGYKEIILVDLRYMGSPAFAEFVEIKDNQDILFLNYTEIYNNSSIISVINKK